MRAAGHSAAIEETADLVVVGGGMAGLAAAVAAAEASCDVLLLEKGEVPGGSAALSGGTIWTAADYQGLRSLVPLGDAELGQVLVESYAPSVDWLARQGVELAPRPQNPYHKVREQAVGLAPSAAVAMAALTRRYLSLGGRLRTRTAAVRLLQDESGAVRGVQAWTPDGGLIARAERVALASGGFAANTELRARYLGRWADGLIVRANRANSGDGYLMGLRAGAGASRGLASFYGAHLPAPPARIEPSALRRVTAYFSEHAILVNRAGRRFADESGGDERSVQETARQEQARCFALFDHHVYRRYAVAPVYPGAEAVDRVAAIQEIGGRVARADALPRLVEEVAAWGVPAESLAQTIEEFNRAVQADRGHRLPVPRRANLHPLREPPLYAIALAAGITYTLGGLRIDPWSRVLDRSSRPIPGLYAAGADAGGLYCEAYAGGLAASLVFGIRAGRHAARVDRRPAWAT